MRLTSSVQHCRSWRAAGILSLQSQRTLFPKTKGKRSQEHTVDPPKGCSFPEYSIGMTLSEIGLQSERNLCDLVCWGDVCTTHAYGQSMTSDDMRLIIESWYCLSYDYRFLPGSLKSCQTNLHGETENCLSLEIWTGSALAWRHTCHIHSIPYRPCKQ